MAEPTVANELDRLQSTYRVRFAGHARVTRDPEELEELVRSLDALEGRATGPEKERITAERDLYNREIEAIRKSHAVPFAVPAARLRLWADLCLQRYARNFAGQDRRTRDVALLESIREELQKLRTEMVTLDKKAPEQGLNEALGAIDNALGVYENELEAIRTVRRTGSLPEQGSRFASLANEQFAIYTMNFAAQPRISRHAPLLARIVSALEEILKGMRSLRLAGMNDPANDNNLKIVEGRIEQYRTEHAAIVAAQKTASVSDRASQLGTAANRIFAEYREEFGGKDRATRDPAKLTALAERLWPLAREMDALDRSADHEINARNLRIVTDNLLLYHREFDLIRKAKAPAGKA